MKCVWKLWRARVREAALEREVAGRVPALGSDFRLAARRVIPVNVSHPHSTIGRPISNSLSLFLVFARLPGPGSRHGEPDTVWLGTRHTRVMIYEDVYISGVFYSYSV